MIRPQDLWMIEPDVAAFRGEDGLIDPSLVRAAVARIEVERPNWTEVNRGLPFDGGVGQPIPSAPPGLGQALKEARRRR